MLDGQMFKIHRTHASEGKNIPPGQRTVHQALPALGTGDGLLLLEEVQPAGKKPMSGQVFLRGARDWSQG